MKNTLKQLTLLGLATLPLTLVADSVMIAGWEFSQFTIGGFNSIGDTLGTGGDFSQAGKLKSNYSELIAGSAAGGPLADAFGTAYYDGTNGSTSAGSLNSSGGDTVFPFAQPLSSLASQIDPPYGSSASENVLLSNGQTIYTDFGLQVNADNDIVFEAVAGYSTTGWIFNIAYQTVSGNPGGQTLEFLYNDGSGFTSFATRTVSATDTGFTQSIPALDGEQAVQIMVRVTGATETNAVMLDNVGIFAEAPAVPAISSSSAGGNLNILFDTIDGIGYTVRSAPNLLTSPSTWGQVTTVAGDGNPASVPVPLPAAGGKVFVVVEGP